MSSSCSTTRPAGVQPKKIVTILKVAYTHITRGISVDRQVSLSMLPKIARCFRMAWVGTTVHVVLNVASAIQQSNAFIILISTRGSSAIVSVAIRQISARSITTRVRKQTLKHCASSMSSHDKASNCPTLIDFAMNSSELMQKSRKNSIN